MNKILLLGFLTLVLLPRCAIFSPLPINIETQTQGFMDTTLSFLKIEIQKETGYFLVLNDSVFIFQDTNFFVQPEKPYFFYTHEDSLFLLIPKSGEIINVKFGDF